MGWKSLHEIQSPLPWCTGWTSHAVHYIHSRSEEGGRPQPTFRASAKTIDPFNIFPPTLNPTSFGAGSATRNWPKGWPHWRSWRAEAHGTSSDPEQGVQGVPDELPEEGKGAGWETGLTKSMSTWRGWKEPPTDNYRHSKTTTQRSHLQLQHNNKNPPDPTPKAHSIHPH